MHNTIHISHHGSAICCAICGGRFGLVRYYCWRVTLCSKRCVVRFKVRREADHKWLRWLRAAGTDSPRPSVLSADRILAE